ncbi:shikimate dehydrogenase [Vibrio natriegens]|uniref:acetyltransferase n=1 Tax=Vibrio natriegens TaxID=691 RepID=UPI0008047967|nr:acetyltransferase [Vibrio natriegens]ANQ20366.1 shikimate dehydrogenase [Vibrio natriegens]ANQ25200.1 shikimate dehydrogenase [Vibrio natriegens]MCY9875978.1 acetyltransferase [Vibrio natriegens]
MNKESLKPLVIIGGGGHASVLVDVLLQQQREILAVICPDKLSDRSIFSGLPHFRKDEDVFRFDSDAVLLVNGVGVLPKSGLRSKLTQFYTAHGYHFETVIASSAQISRFAEVHSGAQILPNAIVQTGATIGRHTIVNTGAIVEHDCTIGQFNHLAPRSTLCGQVTTGDNVYVGAGATVIQNVLLDTNAIVGAGATITQSVPLDTICYPNRVTMKSFK